MSVASTGRPKTKTKTESAGDARGGAQHTVAPAHAPRKRDVAGTRAARKQQTTRGTVIAGSGGETGQPLWGGRRRRALPPEEWS